MAYQGQINTTPWAALADEIKRSAHRVTWVDGQVDDLIVEIETFKAQEHDWEPAQFAGLKLKMSKELRAWLDQSRAERAHLANVSRQALSAGASEQLVALMRAESKHIVHILLRALDASGVEGEGRRVALEEMKVALSEQSGARRAIGV